MLGAIGPIVFAWWLRRYGWRRAAGLVALAAACFLAIVAPFLLWKPGPFLAMVLRDRGALPDDLMAGRFTVLPLLTGMLPHASVVLTALSIAAGSFAAWRARRPQAVVAAMALGLGAALLVHPVSFAHYFLPVVALAAVATGGLGAWYNDAARARKGSSNGSNRTLPIDRPEGDRGLCQWQAFPRTD
jgi:hypothetical protein